MLGSRDASKVLFFALLSVIGCGEHEGDAPGECTDGADNDRDGFYDCDDEDCVFAPDCEDGGGGGDTDDDTSGGGGDDPPDPRLLELETVRVEYTMALDLSLPVFGVENCSMDYVGVGSGRTDAAGTRVSFEGTWRKTGGDCPPEFDQLIWTPDSGVAYHTFVFADDLVRLEEWHAHERADAYTTAESSKPHWYVSEMGQSYDHGNPVVTYQETEPVADIQGNLIHDVSITFTK